MNDETTMIEPSEHDVEKARKSRTQCFVTYGEQYDKIRTFLERLSELEEGLGNRERAHDIFMMSWQMDPVRSHHCCYDNPAVVKGVDRILGAIEICTTKHVNDNCMSEREFIDLVFNVVKALKSDLT